MSRAPAQNSEEGVVRCDRPGFEREGNLEVLFDIAATNRLNPTDHQLIETAALNLVCFCTPCVLTGGDSQQFFEVTMQMALVCKASF